MLEHHKTRATLSGGQGPPPCGSLFPSPRGVGTPWRWVDIARGGPPAEETGKAIVGDQELRWGVLGPVDNHRAAMIAATRLRFAAKLESVLSYRVAIARNSLIFAK